MRITDGLTAHEVAELLARSHVVVAALAEVGYGYVKIERGGNVPPDVMAKALAVAGVPDTLVAKSRVREPGHG